ncbi:MAG: peptide-methionine (S)-S-oxide reductase [Halomonadaceae bacterium]|nr:MAG: peptide-methionine (S)-S-oxide reductase [Halomonadaceae bacterium]
MKLLTTVFLLVLLSISGVAAQGSETSDGKAQALFAGGCFWCMQPPFDALEGVEETVVGFSGGDVSNPSYQQVVAGGTGHLEVMKVTYDPEQVSYQELLAVFWRNIDPLDEGGQFCDRGEHYRAAIFPMNDQQRQLAEASRDEINNSGRFDSTVRTRIMDARNFYAAEEYHQDYYLKNPLRYRYYTRSCGRQNRLDTVWGS